MKKTSLSSVLMIAVVGAAALAGCKKKEETAMTPEPAPAPAPMAEPAPAPVAPAVRVTSVTVGNAVGADMSVAPMAMLAAKDKIIVSVKTSGTANNVNLAAKLMYQDGQVAGEQSAMLNTTDTGTTNLEFTKATPWPAGKYTAEVMVDGKAVGMPQQFEVK
jgi:hypothetical protein